MFGISSASNIASSMFSDTSLVFLGGFIFSIAMVKWNLHSRISLKTVLIFGLKPRILLLGIMIVTSFLSMWISNTATALTMVPNALAIVTKLEEITGDSKLIEPFSKTLFLTIAFSSSIGGMATLIGTPPNLICSQTVTNIFPESPGIGFAQFLFLALPTSIIILIIIYLIFAFIFMRKLKINENVDESCFKDNYQKLGKMKPAEIIIGLLFILLAILWLFRCDLNFGSFTIKGWTTLILGSNGSKIINDGTIAICISILLFIIKVPQISQKQEEKLKESEVNLSLEQITQENKKIKQEILEENEYNSEDQELIEEISEFDDDNNNNNNNDNEENQNEDEIINNDNKEWIPILEWEYVQQKIPWTIIFMFSGGFALNQGFTDSLLGEWLGNQLRSLTDLSLFVLLICICFVASILSNIASNTACANIFLPIVANLAKNGKKFHPYLLMIPTAFATSCCFIMPVATPPNLICYGSGKLKMKDFLIYGSIINIISLFVVIGASIILIPPIFNANEFPDWANTTTITE